MAAKPHFQLLFLALAFAAALAAASASDSHSQYSSPFGFLKHLEGCHKGEKVKGIHQVKDYLEKYGYVHYDVHSANKSKSSGDDDDELFDDLLEAAVKTYQKNYHLHPSGALDAKTVSMMSMPRCGCPDIINGTNTMQDKRSSSNHGGRHLGSFKTVSHYEFFPNNLRWPAGKTRLTYGFEAGTQPRFSRIIARAFNKWAANSHFTFSQVDFSRADMKVGFHGIRRGTSDSFDGRGGVLAHAWAPTDGRAHYDIDENWADGAVHGAFDLESVALHEIGHQLGLAHSQVEGAIMWASFGMGQRKALHADDIQGIKALYGTLN